MSFESVAGIRSLSMETSTNLSILTQASSMRFEVYPLCNLLGVFSYRFFYRVLP